MHFGGSPSEQLPSVVRRRGLNRGPLARGSESLPSVKGKLETSASGGLGLEAGPREMFSAGASFGCKLCWESTCTCISMHGIYRDITEANVIGYT